jgi:hypothetical protein
MLGFKEHERLGDGARTAPWKIRLSRAVNRAAPLAILLVYAIVFSLLFHVALNDTPAYDPSSILPVSP